MKSRNSHLPRALAVLPFLDAFQPDNADETGGGTIVGPFDSVDFKIVPSNLGPEIHYSEMHLSSSPGGSNPIKDQDNPERSILAMPLPQVGGNWSMTLQLQGPKGSDAVQISRVQGKYDVLLNANRDFIIYEEMDEFFTIQQGSEGFVTYVNINQMDEVVKLNHGTAQVFDLFSMSFLGLSNA